MIDEFHCCRPRDPADNPIRRAYRARQRYERMCSEQKSVMMASRCQERGQILRAPKRHDIEEDELTISSLKRELAAVMCASEMQYKRDVARDCGHEQTSRRRLNVRNVSSHHRVVIVQVPEVQLSRVGLFEINPTTRRRHHKPRSEMTTVQNRVNHRAGERKKTAALCAPRHRQQKPPPARDDSSTNSCRRERWQDYLHSSWRSLEDECMSSSSSV